MNIKPSVLVVEDNISWQENYKEALEGIGFNVIIVEDLATALKTLTKQFFHIAIVDLELKGEKGNRDGRDVIKRIWSFDEGTRFLVSTGKGELSMFDEFSEMGIFSFTQIPTIDQAKIKGLQAYDGLIAKEKDTLDKILADVENALEKSWRDYIKLQIKHSPFKIIKGYDAKNIQRALRVGKIEELRPFLSSLVQPLFPWLNSKSGSAEVKNKNGDTIAFESVCWSRALGYPVAIRFGRRDELENIAEFSTEIQCTIMEKIYEVPVSQDAKQPFKGIVYKVNLEFDNNFDLPPIKKQVNR